MNFSEIRKGIAKIDNDVVELKTLMLAETAIHGENKTLQECITECSVIFSGIKHLKEIVQETEIEEQEMAREDWENKQIEIEEEYYKEN